MSENIEETITVEEPKKKKGFFKNKMSTRDKTILVLFLACTIAGLGLFLFSSLNWTAEEIFTSLQEKVTTIEIVSVEDNVVYFKDSVVKKDVEYTGVIEVFNNKDEALLKKEYYETLDQEMAKLFNEELLGPELAKTYSTGKWKMYVNGNTLIRLSYHYSDYQIKQLNKQFNLVMDKVYQTEKNVPTPEQQKTIRENYKKQVDEEVKQKKENLISDLNEKLDSLKAEVEDENTSVERLLEIKEEAEHYKTIVEVAQKALDIQDLVDERIQAMVDHVDQLLDEALETYSRDKIQEAQDAIALLTHDVFAEYKDPWNKRIEQILYKIKEKEIQDYKDKCETFSYYNIDESYKGKHAYFYGKIYRITTNTNGGITYIVNTEPQYLLGSIAYWTNSVYVEMDSDIASLYTQGDTIHMWGTIEGMVVNEQVFGDAKTYPKFYCKYASE